MKKKHLALITLHADPVAPSGVGEGGGTHAYVRELIRSIPKEGWQMTVLTRWADPLLPECEIVSPRIKIVRLRINTVGPLNKRLLNDLHLTSLSAARTALTTEPEVSLFHSVYWNSGRVAEDLSRESGLPFVHTVISNGYRRWLQGARDQAPNRMKIERQVFEAAFAIFCVSGQEKADLIEYYNLHANKIFVVGRPVALPFRVPCHDEWGTPSKPPISDTNS